MLGSEPASPEGRLSTKTDLDFILTCSFWCREPDSNRHGPCGPRDFKSRVSTKFHHPGVKGFNNLLPRTRQPVQINHVPIIF